VAIALEFLSVIIRKESLECKYPGGINAFVRQNLPNFLEDSHLIRVGFMSTRDADELVSMLVKAGFVSSDEPSSDLAIVSKWEQPNCPWLTIGEHDGFTACWLANEPPGDLVEIVLDLLIRMPREVYARIGEIATECGAHLTTATAPPNPPCDALLVCWRGEAKIELDVFGNPTSDLTVGLWGRWDHLRRKYREDTTLMRDLRDRLVQAGAETP
jgi:hypothetical protein